MMDEATQRKIYGAVEEYRAHVRRIADNLETPLEEKQQQAEAGYQAALSMQQQAAREWSASLDERAADLEKVLYHGDKDYKEAVRSLADKSPAELEEAARIASRTGDTEMARAAAVVAREKDYPQVFFDYVQGNDDFSEAFAELEQIPSPEERRRYVSNFTVKRASGQDLQPSLAAQQAHQEERIQRPPGFYFDGQILPQKPQPQRQVGGRRA